MPLLPPILSLVIALAAIEGSAWWWMHPTPAGLGDPILTYQPSRSAGVSPAAQEKPKLGDSRSQIVDRRSATENAPAQPPTASSSRNQKSAIINHQSSISTIPQTNLLSVTSLPEIVARALPSLRCSTGTASRIDTAEGVTIHTAFFEWDLASSTSVLEAFKHLPDECMGSIGMTLTAHHSPRPYQVGNETLSFDHSIFRDPQGEVIHAFKGVWVSGSSGLLGNGLRGGGEQARQLRWKAGLHRFRPAHARVAQGAVRGIPNPDLAWETFQSTMLVDLKME